MKWRNNYSSLYFFSHSIALCLQLFSWQVCNFLFLFFLWNSLAITTSFHHMLFYDCLWFLVFIFLIPSKFIYWLYDIFYSLKHMVCYHVDCSILTLFSIWKKTHSQPCLIVIIFVHMWRAWHFPLYDWKSKQQLLCK